MRTHSFAVLGASLVSVLAACSGAADPVAYDMTGLPPVTAAAPSGRSIDLDLDLGLELRESDPARASDYFVWTRDEEERVVTYHLDARGREIEKVDGIVIATASGNWQWHEEGRTISTLPCQYEDDEGHELVGDPVGSGVAMRASLRNTAAGVEQVVVEPGGDMEGNTDIQHGVRVAASVGPYLFIEEAAYTYTCGAHGNTEVSTTIWDAATGRTVAMPMDLGPLQAPRLAAMSELADGEDDLFAPMEDSLELTEIVPKYASDGALVVGLQFTAPTCYACTRGGWSSYTKSTVVDSVNIPQILSPFATPPRAVRAVADSHPDVVIGGWSAR